VYPVNVGNPQEINMIDFAKEVMALVGNDKASISYFPLPEDDPKQRKPDISLAKRLLNWEPNFDRAAGMKLTYEYFKKVVSVS
jgi:dTDP-glucose 4,6-dehydratase